MPFPNDQTDISFIKIFKVLPKRRGFIKIEDWPCYISFVELQTFALKATLLPNVEFILVKFIKSPLINDKIAGRSRSTLHFREK